MKTALPDWVNFQNKNKRCVNGNQEKLRDPYKPGNTSQCDVIKKNNYKTFQSVKFFLAIMYNAHLLVVMQSIRKE